MNNDDISPTRPLYEGITLPFWDVIYLVAAGIIIGVTISILFVLLVV